MRKTVKTGKFITYMVLITLALSVSFFSTLILRGENLFAGSVISNSSGSADPGDELNSAAYFAGSGGKDGWLGFTRDTQAVFVGIQLVPTLDSVTGAYSKNDVVMAEGLTSGNNKKNAGTKSYEYAIPQAIAESKYYQDDSKNSKEFYLLTNIPITEGMSEAYAKSGLYQYLRNIKAGNAELVRDFGTLGLYNAKGRTKAVSNMLKEFFSIKSNETDTEGSVENFISLYEGSDIDEAKKLVDALKKINEDDFQNLEIFTGIEYSPLEFSYSDADSILVYVPYSFMKDELSLADSKASNYGLLKGLALSELRDNLKGEDYAANIIPSRLTDVANYTSGKYVQLKNAMNKYEKLESYVSNIDTSFENRLAASVITSEAVPVVKEGLTSYTVLDNAEAVEENAKYKSARDVAVFGATGMTIVGGSEVKGTFEKDATAAVKELNKLLKDLDAYLIENDICDIQGQGKTLEQRMNTVLKYFEYPKKERDVADWDEKMLMASQVFDWLFAEYFDTISLDTQSADTSSNLAYWLRNEESMGGISDKLNAFYTSGYCVNDSKNAIVEDKNTLKIQKYVQENDSLQLGDKALKAANMTSKQKDNTVQFRQWELQGIILAMYKYLGAKGEDAKDINDLMRGYNLKIGQVDVYQYSGMYSGSGGSTDGVIKGFLSEKSNYKYINSTLSVPGALFCTTPSTMLNILLSANTSNNKNINWSLTLANFDLAMAGALNVKAPIISTLDKSGAKYYGSNELVDEIETITVKTETGDNNTEIPGVQASVGGYIEDVIKNLGGIKGRVSEKISLAYGIDLEYAESSLKDCVATASSTAQLTNLGDINRRMFVQNLITAGTHKQYTTYQYTIYPGIVNAGLQLSGFYFLPGGNTGQSLSQMVASVKKGKATGASYSSTDAGTAYLADSAGSFAEYLGIATEGMESAYEKLSSIGLFSTGQAWFGSLKFGALGSDALNVKMITASNIGKQYVELILNTDTGKSGAKARNIVNPYNIIHASSINESTDTMIDNAYLTSGMLTLRTKLYACDSKYMITANGKKNQIQTGEVINTIGQKGITAATYNTFLVQRVCAIYDDMVNVLPSEIESNTDLIKHELASATVNVYFNTAYVKSSAEKNGAVSMVLGFDNEDNSIKHTIKSTELNKDTELVLGLSVNNTLLDLAKEDDTEVYAYITVTGDDDGKLMYSKTNKSGKKSTLNSSLISAEAFKIGEKSVSKYGDLFIDLSDVQDVPLNESKDTTSFIYDNEFLSAGINKNYRLAESMSISGADVSGKNVIIVNLTDKLSKLKEAGNYLSNKYYDVEVGRWNINDVAQFSTTESEITLAYDRSYTLGAEVAVVVKTDVSKSKKTKTRIFYSQLNADSNCIKSEDDDSSDVKTIKKALKDDSSLKIDDPNNSEKKVYAAATVIGLGANVGQFRTMADKKGKAVGWKNIHILKKDGSSVTDMQAELDTNDADTNSDMPLNQLWFSVESSAQTPIVANARVIYEDTKDHEKSDVAVGTSLNTNGLVEIELAWSNDTDVNPKKKTLEQWKKELQDAGIDTVVVHVKERTGAGKGTDVYNLDKKGNKAVDDEGWLTGMVGKTGINGTKKNAEAYSLDKFIELLDNGGSKLHANYLIDEWQNATAAKKSDGATSTTFHASTAVEIDYAFDVKIVGLKKIEGQASKYYNKYGHPSGTTNADYITLTKKTTLRKMMKNENILTIDLLNGDLTTACYNISELNAIVLGDNGDGNGGINGEHECYLIAGGKVEQEPKKIIIRSVEEVGYLPLSYATVKEGNYSLTGTTPTQEYNVLAGVPSTSKLYYTSGGSEFIVELAMVGINDEEAVRTYTSVFKGRDCKFLVGDTASAGGGTVTSVKKNSLSHEYNNETVIGQLTDTFVLPVPKSSGGLSNAVYTVPAHGGTTITATWKGTIGNTTGDPGVVLKLAPIDMLSQYTGNQSYSASGNNKTISGSVGPGQHFSGYPGEMNKASGQEKAGSAGGTYSWNVTDYNTALQNAYDWAVAIEKGSQGDGNVVTQSDSDHATRSWHAGDARIAITLEHVNDVTNGNSDACVVNAHEGTWSNGTWTTANVLSLTASGGAKLITNDDKLSSGYFESYGNKENYSGTSCQGPSNSSGRTGYVTSTWADESNLLKWQNQGHPKDIPYSYTASHTCSHSGGGTSPCSCSPTPNVINSTYPETFYGCCSSVNSSKIKNATHSHSYTTIPGSEYSPTTYSCNGCKTTAGVAAGSHTCSASHSVSGYKETVTKKSPDVTYTITVTFTNTYLDGIKGTDGTVSKVSCSNGNYPKHSCCGPCCEHKLETITDNWVQYSKYSYLSIEDISVWKIYRSYVKGLNELTYDYSSSGYLLGKIENGDPNIWYNIGDMNLVYKDHYLYGKKQEASAAGRLRYSVQAQQLDDVIWFEKNTEGKNIASKWLECRTGDCNGQSKTVASNPVKINADGHKLTYALGCLYGRTSDTNGTFIGQNESVETQPGTVYAGGTATETYAYDGITYKNVYYTESTDDANHKNVYTDTEGFLKDIQTTTVKTKWADNTADERDQNTVEYKRWVERRETPVTVYVVSDLLILQTSTGDEKIVYGSANTVVNCEQHALGISVTEKDTVEPQSVVSSDIDTDYRLRDSLLGGYNGKGNVNERVTTSGIFTGGAVSEVNTLLDTGKNMAYSADKKQTDSKASVTEPRMTYSSIANVIDAYSPVSYKSSACLGQARMNRVSNLKIGLRNIQINPIKENGLYRSEVAVQTWYEILDWTDTSSPCDDWTLPVEYIKGSSNYGKDDVLNEIVYKQEAYYYDSNSKPKVNDVIVHTPISDTYTYLYNYDGPIEDQRSGNGSAEYSSSGSDYCPGKSELCDYSYLNCKYAVDEIVYSTKFDYETIKQIKDADGNLVSTNKTTLSTENGYLVDTVAWQKVNLPSIASVIEDTSTGNMLMLNYNSLQNGELEIPVDKIQLKYRNTLEYTISMLYKLTSSSLGDTTIVKCGSLKAYVKQNDNNHIYITDGTNTARYETGSIIGSFETIKIKFSYAGLNSCAVYVDGTACSGSIISGTSKVIESTDVAGVISIGSGDNKSAVVIDNLVITRLAGSLTHTAACYTTVVNHEKVLNYSCDTPVEISAGIKGAQSFTAPVDGLYRIECYGAAGGSANANSSSEATISTGGLGGYASGEIYLSAGQTVYAYVGTQGQKASGNGTGGGWNGGGNASGNAYGGGGMTYVSYSGTDVEGSKTGEYEVTVAPYTSPVSVVNIRTNGSSSVNVEPGIYYIETVGGKGKGISGYYATLDSSKLYYSVGDNTWLGFGSSIGNRTIMSSGVTGGANYTADADVQNIKQITGLGSSKTVNKKYWIHQRGSDYGSDTLHTTTSDTYCTQCGSSSGYLAGNTAYAHAHGSGCSFGGYTHISTGYTCNCSHGNCSVTVTTYSNPGTETVSTYVSGWLVIYKLADLSSVADADSIQYDASGEYKEQAISKEFNYTGGMQSLAVGVGTYTLEVYGAQGGYTGGLGGYSKGTYTTDKSTTLYIGIGGVGSSSGGGGYNGGGHGRGAGGGATHIATANGVLSSLASNKNAILIVAGGGGGSGPATGGYGGGANMSGGNGASRCGAIGYGASVNSPGGGASTGSFGQGGNGVHGGYTGNGYAGGGGGYYGGGGARGDYPTWNDFDDCGAGGGSGYANTSLLTSISGSNGVRSGNGYAKITGTEKVLTVAARNIIATYKSNGNDGIFDTDKVLVLAGGGGGAKGKSASTNMNGTVITLNYTGSVQSVTLQPGTYKLEAWGASGGSGDSYSNMNGLGGYTAGTIEIKSATTLYVYVGGAGVYNSQSLISGTFNGGGDNGSAGSTASSNAGHFGGSGGGATDFRLVGGSWNDTNGLKSRILVAGGGGGAGCASSHNPGHGGGLVGVTTVNTGYYYGSSATGGSQTAGGTGNGKTTINGSTWGTAYGNGSFGVGANACQCGAGGGGGYYGGGTNYTAGGGGGSSYVSGYAGCDTTYLANQKIGGVNTTFTYVEMQQGVNSGNGYAKITQMLGEDYFDCSGGDGGNPAENGKYNRESNGGVGATQTTGYAQGLGESYSGAGSVAGAGAGWYGGCIDTSNWVLTGAQVYDSRGCTVNGTSITITNTSAHCCSIGAYGQGSRYVKIIIHGSNLKSTLNTLTCCTSYGQKVISQAITSTKATFVIDKGAGNENVTVQMGAAWYTTGGVIDSVDTILLDSANETDANLGGAGGGSSYVRSDVENPEYSNGVNFNDGYVVITLLEHDHTASCSTTSTDYNSHVHSSNCIGNSTAAKEALEAAIINAKNNNKWDTLLEYIGMEDVDDLQNSSTYTKAVYDAIVSTSNKSNTKLYATVLAKINNMFSNDKQFTFANAESVDGGNNPIFSCCNHNDAHICGNKCITTTTLNCTEPHHSGKHYSPNDDICYDACCNDANHRIVSGMRNISAKEIGDRIQLDDYFTLHWDNTGDFYDFDADNVRYASSNATTLRGQSYVDGEDTTRWIRAKVLIFDSVDVLFYNEDTGLWEEYLAGEAINLPVITDGIPGNGNDDVNYRDWREADQRAKAITEYKFYLLLSNNEHKDATYSAYTIAINDPYTNSDKEHVYDIGSSYLNKENPESTNKVRSGAYSNYSSYESAFKQVKFDVAGSIGNLLVVHSEDFRYSNFFKKITEDWLVTPFLHTVDENVQAKYLGIGINSLGKLYDVRFRDIAASTQYYNTWLTENWTASATPVNAIVSADIRGNFATELDENLLGYKLYGEYTTIGDYESVEIVPSLYILDTYTGDIMNADAWEKTSSGYKMVLASGLDKADREAIQTYGMGYMSSKAEFGLIKDAVFDSASLYVSLGEEKGARNVSDEEISRSRSIAARYFPNITDEGVAAGDSVSEAKVTVGTSNLISLTGTVRSFIGSPHTNTEIFNGQNTTDVDGKINETKFAVQARRWLATFGFNENTYIVPYSSRYEGGKHLNPNRNMSDGLNPITDLLYAEKNEGRYVILYGIDTYAYGDVWDLEYEAFKESQIITVNGKKYSLPTSVSDIIAVFDMRMEEQDYDIIKTH